MLLKKLKYHFNEFRAQREEFNRKWKQSFPFTTPSSPPSFPPTIPKIPSWCDQEFVILVSLSLMAVAVVVAACLLLFHKYLLTNKALRS